MRTFSKMLAVVDTRKDTCAALERARSIAEQTGMPIIALAPNSHSDESSRTRLNAMLQPLRDAGIEISGSEEWHTSVVQTIVHACQLENCSLVIKDPRKTNNLTSLFFTPEDWTLLRRCRVPVLLARTHADSWINGRILAAVDACPYDDNHDILNRVILENTAAIAELANAECHIGTAYPGTMLGGRSSVRETRAKYEQNCLPMAARHAIPEENIHVEEGPADSFIPSLAKRIDASLIVMGSVASCNISNELLGNTAEQILGKIETDVLVLRPRDLMDPLETILD